MPITAPATHRFTLNSEFMARRGGPDAGRTADQARMQAASTQDMAAASLPEELTAEKVLERYENDIAVLHGFLDPQSDGMARQSLEKFGVFLMLGIGLGDAKPAFSPDVLDHFLTQVSRDFSLVCAHALDSELPLETRRQAVLNMAEGLQVCAPGVAQNIEAAALELDALKTGVSQYFVNKMVALIDETILGHMRDTQICEDSGSEIHYVAAFFNHVALNYGLPLRTDVYQPVLAKDVLDGCTGHILNNITIEVAIERMADDCLAQVESFYTPGNKNFSSTAFDLDEVAILYSQFNDRLKPTLERGFGPVDAGDFFRVNEEDDYEFVRDRTLITRSIARNLRDAGIVDFKAAYLVGDKNSESKLKLIGDNLIYVSKSTKVKAVDGKVGSEKYLVREFFLHEQAAAQDMLKNLELNSARKPQAVKAYGEIFQMLIKSVSQKMKAAANMAQSIEILEQAVSTLVAEPAAKKIFAAALGQALWDHDFEITEVFAQELKTKHPLVLDGYHVAPLMFALANGGAVDARLLIEKLSPEQLSVQSGEYKKNALMFALDKNDFENALRIVEKLSAEQLSIHGGMNNENALMFALNKWALFIGPVMDRTFVGYQDVGFNEEDAAFELDAEVGSAAIAKRIIEKSNPEQLSAKGGENNKTVLMHSLNYYHSDNSNLIIRKLSAEQLNVKGGEDDGTALVYAMKVRDADSVELLVRKLTAEQLCVKNGAGENTALMFALYDDHYASALLIINKLSSEQLRIENKGGFTALAIARLLEAALAGDDVEDPDDEGSELEQVRGIIGLLEKRLAENEA